MSYAQDKSDAANAVQSNGDSKARCKLKKHLCFKGYYVSESDEVGPVQVIVRGGDSLETWRRESKSDGDFNMTLVSRQALRYEYP